MSLLKHLFLATSYVLFAVAVALVLPSVVVSIDSQWAMVIAGFVLIGSALMHEAMARGEHNVMATEQYHALYRGYERLREELVAMGEESSILHKALKEKFKEKKSAPNLNKVVAEVRVLQNLIEQISQSRYEEAVSQDALHRDGPRANRASAPVAEFEDVTNIQQVPYDDAQVLEIIHEALRSDRVEMFLQPVVSLPQRKPRFYECFTRIRAADGNMILPEQYIPIAEREGLVAAIDNLLLFRCVQLVRKAQSKSHNVGFFCNISSRTLQDRAFFKDFIQFMVANSELSHNLIFEFSQADLESMWMEVETDLEQLVRLGYVFSMDRVTDMDLDCDILAKRHVKFVKVDVENLLSIRWPETEATEHLEPAAARQMAEAAVDGGAAGDGEAAPEVVIPPLAPAPPAVDMEGLRRELDRANIDLIVEKVERETDLIEILEFRIDFGQGFLFGEPRPSRDG
ncbi:MAG: EAL domain-containing protein [Alphaproteobacteria bacterium]